jgi:deoxyribodipyrimidine photolyase-related protein
MTSRLILILGDQLSRDISSFSDIDKKRDTVMLVEVMEEATYVKHHKKKIAFLFSAMRHFAQELEEVGFTVRYTKLDDKKNTGSFTGEVKRAITEIKSSEVVVTFPGEYRVAEDMKTWEKKFGVKVEIRPDDRFLVTPEAFAQWASKYKSLRMEIFYREMRKAHDILMDGAEPEGGSWNYDHENRKPAKAMRFNRLTDPPKINPDKITQDVIALVVQKFPDHFGDLEPFDFAVTRNDALHLMREFITHRLPKFGDYQDVMVTGEPVLYHAHLSFYINCGLLSPMEVVRAAEDAYKKGQVPLNAAEGFIRQIIGWREYVRGIYWLRMPGFKRENALNAKRDLPWLYWSGETDMNCMHQCVKETKENAYAHHIQRLMVLGNFALIAGIHPDQVNDWYMVVYADAYE